MSNLKYVHNNVNKIIEKSTTINNNIINELEHVEYELQQYEIYLLDFK